MKLSAYKSSQLGFEKVEHYAVAVDTTPQTIELLALDAIRSINPSINVGGIFDTKHRLTFGRFHDVLPLVDSIRAHILNVIVNDMMCQIPISTSIQHIDMFGINTLGFFDNYVAYQLLLDDAIYSDDPVDVLFDPSKAYFKYTQSLFLPICMINHLMSQYILRIKRINKSGVERVMMRYIKRSDFRIGYNNTMFIIGKYKNECKGECWHSMHDPSRSFEDIIALDKYYSDSIDALLPMMSIYRRGSAFVAKIL